MTQTYDVIVVGLGPGGEFAGNKLAQGGLRVLAIDKHLAGGECPYYGCIPSKLMMRAATAVVEARQAPGVAGECDVRPDWRAVADRVARGTRGWGDTASVRRLEKAGATVLHGEARLTGPRSVAVDGTDYTATQGVLLATGTAPAAPPIEGLDGTPYWTNRDIVKVTELPASLVVIGAGPIGCEFAQALARFGVEVTLLEASDRILTKEEPEVSALMTDVLRRDGMEVRAGVDIRSVRHDGERFTVELDGGDVVAERLLVAAGRDAGLPRLGLENVGVDPTDRKSVAVDGRMRVVSDDGGPVDGLWAVGDMVGEGLFTHVAKYQAAIVVRQLLGGEGPEARYDAVPRVTFTYPEVGAVGLTEQEAREAGHEVRVGVVDNRDSSRGDLHGEGSDGFVKLVAEGDRLLGGTSVGPMGGEVLAMLTTAVHGAVPVSTLRSMIYAYPTWHGVVRQALSALERPVAAERPVSAGQEPRG
jgi:pyruvate/2-oxoglutarate dehydrogenase complex dihydrolipoamide dehydrogenase (E3) component